MPDTCDKKFEGKARSFSLIGRMLCFAVAGILLQKHATLPYWTTTLSSLVSVVFVATLPVLPKNTPKKFPKENFFFDLIVLSKELIANKNLILVIIQGISVFVLTRIVIVNLFQPILIHHHLSVAFFGIIMALMTGFEALGSFFPGLLSRWISDLRAIIILTIAMALTLLGMTQSSITACIMLVCFSFFAGLIFPMQKQLMNETIKISEKRATLLSIESIVDRLICAGVASILSVFVANGKIMAFLDWASALTVFVMVVLFVVLHAKKTL